MNTHEALRSRRSVRTFRYQPVEGAQLVRLLEGAVAAPSTLNAQSWAFAVVEDRVLLRRISDTAKEIGRREGAGRPAHELALVPPADPAARELADPQFDLLHGAPVLVVVGTRARGELADADCWLATQNLLLGAHAEGLGSCIVGAVLPALRTPEILRLLGLPDAFRPVAPVVLGTPKDPALRPRPERRAPEVLAWKKAY